MSWIRRISVCPWSAVVVVVLAGSALADEPKKPAPSPAPAPPEFHSVRLKYTKASETAKLLESVFSIRIVSDERTNTLLIRGSAAQLAEIREALKSIDTNEADAAVPAPEISIFQLRSVEPGRVLEDALRLVIGKKATGAFALDKTRKTVIVSADKMTTDAVEALLARLDVMGNVRAEEDVQVRVVWLVSTSAPTKGSGDDVGSAPPDYIKEVLPGLAKLGIERPRVLATLGVNAQPNAQFGVKGTLDPYDVSVSGRFNSGTAPPGLEITIQAKRVKEVICNLQTEISAPLGHLVVLGLTPIGRNISSAFVLQVQRKAGK